MLWGHLEGAIVETPVDLALCSLVMARIDQETYSREPCRGGSDKKVSFEHSADQTEANEGVLGMIRVYKIPLIALGALVSVTLCP